MSRTSKIFNSFSVSSSSKITLDDHSNLSENDDMEIIATDSKYNSGDNRFSIDFNSKKISDISRQRLQRQSSCNNQQTVNPLDLLQKKEIQSISFNDKTIKTHLSDKNYLESKLPVIQFEEIRLISIRIAPSSSYNSISPSALAISTDLILIGFTSGQILVFNQSGQELLTLKLKKGLGQVTSMDITTDQQFAIAGYQFGQICL